MADGIVHQITTPEARLKNNLCFCDRAVQRTTDRVIALTDASLRSLSTDAEALLMIRVLLQTIREEMEDLEGTVDGLAADADAYHQRRDDPVLERILAQRQAQWDAARGAA